MANEVAQDAPHQKGATTIKAKHDLFFEQELVLGCMNVVHKVHGLMYKLYGGMRTRNCPLTHHQAKSRSKLTSPAGFVTANSSG